MDKFLSRDNKGSSIELKILIPSVLISIIGVITLLSSTILPDGTFGDTTVVSRQIVFIIIGYFLYFIISKIDLSYTRYWQIILPIYIVTLLVLTYLVLFGPVISNVRRWLIIGGVQVQPSEFAKITVIFLTAYTLSLKDKYNQWLLFLISFLLVLPISFLIYLEPDGSMSVLVILIWFFVAFTGLDDQLRNSISLIIIILGIFSFLLSSILSNPIWMLLILVSLTIAIFAYYHKDQWRMLIVTSFLISILLGIGTSLVWNRVLRDYQRDRVEVFLDPTKDTGDAGFNVAQAKIAIGSGRIWGKGFGNGTQSKRSFLPEYRTDFVFASFAEEFGLVGAVFLLILFCVIILTGLNKTIELSNNPFFAMLVLGFSVKILLEVFINVGTNTGVIPATGIPLPLVSAGGSSVLVTLFSLGVIQSIISHSTKVEDTAEIVQTYES